MNFEIRHAFRYVRSKRGGLARITTLAAVAGIAFGVGCLILVQAIYTGFREGIEKKLLDQAAHITVTAGDSGGVSPAIVTGALNRVANVKSVEPALFQSSVISKDGKSGYGLLRVTFADDPSQKISPGALVGKELAKRLELKPGDIVSLFKGDAHGTAGYSEFKIAGTIETGLIEYDSTLIKMREDYYNSVFPDSRAVPNTFLLTLERPFDAGSTGKRVKKALGPAYSVMDWRSANRPLFEALSFERRIASIVFGLMIAIASLGVTATLALLVNERQIDLAILKTCGAKSRSLILIFLTEGVIIALIGVSVGIILGYASCWGAESLGLVSLSGGVYSISSITLEPGLLSTFYIGAGAFLLVLPSIIVPVLRAARSRPGEILRGTG